MMIIVITLVVTVTSYKQLMSIYSYNSECYHAVKLKVINNRRFVKANAESVTNIC